MRIHLSPRTWRGVGDAIVLPGILGVILALLLFLGEWFGGGG